MEKTSRSGGVIPLSQSIAQLQQQGELDSSGRFTLDPARARQLLRDCQLSQPHHYILCLVSCLVGFGATSIRLDTNKGRVQLVGQGVSLPQEVVANPLDRLFSGQGQPADRELAIGINAALAYPTARVTLTTGEFVGTYQADRFDCQPSPTGPAQHTTFHIERPGDGSDEAEAVAQAFAWCPIEVTINGASISQTIATSNIFVLHLSPSQPTPANALNLDWDEHIERLTHPAPLQACIWVGSELPVCRWLYLGRCYEKPLPWTPLDGDLPLQMWVATDQLDKDLSLGQIVENERYQRVTQFLYQSFVKAVDKLLERALLPQGFSPEQMRRLRPLVVYAIEASARRGSMELALQLQDALHAYPRSHQQVEMDKYRQSLLLEASGRVGPRIEVGAPLEEQWSAARASLAIRGPNHPQSRPILVNCAEAAFRRKRYDIAEKCLAADPNLDLPARAKLGRSLLHLGRVQEAQEPLQVVVKNFDSGSTMPEWALDAQEDLATAQAQLGEVKEAARTLADLLRRRQALWGSHSLKLGVILSRLTLLCQQVNDTPTATYYANWARNLR